jgi:hypothetical protein
MKKIHLLVFLFLALNSCKNPKLALRKLNSDEMNRYMQLNPSPPKDIVYMDLQNHPITLDSVRAFRRKQVQKIKIEYYADATNKIVQTKIVKSSDEEIKAIQAESKRFLENTPLPIVNTNCDSLTKKIAGLIKLDQDMRTNAPYDGVKDIQIQMEATSIIEHCGWDLIARSDRENIHSLFIIVQHANKFTRNKYFKKFEEYSKTGYLAPRSLALMQDRMLMDNNQPQIYGTQIIVKNDKQSIWPIKDGEKVDERRLNIGLDSLSIYLRGFGLTYPKDLYDMKLGN